MCNREVAYGVSRRGIRSRRLCVAVAIVHPFGADQAARTIAHRAIRAFGERLSAQKGHALSASAVVHEGDRAREAFGADVGADLFRR